MMSRIRQKWRPPLALVLGGVLGVVLCLPMVGLFMLRDLGPMMGWTKAFLVLGCGILGVTLLMGWLLWRLIVRPMNGLVARTARLKDGDKSAALPMDKYGTPELQRLGQAVLDMAGALQTRADSLRQYSDHVTHELKSPLTTLQGAAEMLRTARDPQEIAMLSDLVGQSTDRMEQLLDSMRDLAAARAPLEGPDVRLSEMLLHHEAVKVEIIEDGLVPMSREALQLVLDHLIQNAAEHGAKVVRLQAVPDGLRIEDDGAGITQGNLDRVFEPFFTTKRERGGTGMGLAIVAGVVEGQGGQITVQPAEVGTRFSIRF